MSVVWKTLTTFISSTCRKTSSMSPDDDKNNFVEQHPAMQFSSYTSFMTWTSPNNFFLCVRLRSEWGRRVFSRCWCSHSRLIRLSSRVHLLLHRCLLMNWISKSVEFHHHRVKCNFSISFRHTFASLALIPVCKFSPIYIWALLCGEEWRSSIRSFLPISSFQLEIQQQQRYTAKDLKCAFFSFFGLWLSSPFVPFDNTKHIKFSRKKELGEEERKKINVYR